MYGNDNAGLVMRKRVVVVVDQTSHSKHAMMWALTHVANKGDLLTLLHIIPPSDIGSGERTSDAYSPYLASSLGSLCKASRPEVCCVYVQERLFFVLFLYHFSSLKLVLSSPLHKKCCFIFV